MAPSLDSTLGAVELAILLSSVLYGVTTMQAYLYLQSPRQDRLWLRGLAAIVWFLETLHQVTVFALLYDWSVTNYANPAAMNEVKWHLVSSVIFQAWSGVMVQAFFAWRVFILSKNIWLAAPPWLLCSARCISSTVLAILAVRRGDLQAFEHENVKLIVASSLMSAVVDLWNTGLLCWYLSRQETAFKQTSQLINRLMLFSLEAGIVTSAAAITLAVTVLAAPQNGVWIAVMIVYAKLFSNALFVSLNVTSRRGDTSHMSLHNDTASSPSNVRVTVDRNIHVELSPLEQSAVHRLNGMQPRKNGVDGRSSLDFKHTP